MHVEDGVNISKRTDDKTLCAMVMGLWELLLFHLLYDVFCRGCESRIRSCWRAGVGNVEISLAL